MSFFFLGLCKKKFTPSSLSSFSFFSSSLLYLPHLLVPPRSRNIPAPILFSYLNAYLVSLELQTFGFPLDSCPDALPVSHGDLDASFTIFNYICIVVWINFLKLFKSNMYVGPSPSQFWKQTWQLVLIPHCFTQNWRSLNSQRKESPVALQYLLKMILWWE